MTDETCLQYLFTLRYPHVRCPACKRSNQYYRHASKQCFTCACGRDHIYPRKGTIFESSTLPLPVWFEAIELLYQSKNRISIRKLQKTLDINFATAKKMKISITALLPSE